MTMIGLWKKIPLFIVVAIIIIITSEMFLKAFGVESSVRAVIDPIAGLVIASVAVNLVNLE